MEPGVRRGAFPHDLFIWKGCGCLLSPAGRRRRGAGEKVKSLCEVKVAFTAPALLRMFSVGEHLQLGVLFRCLVFFLSLFVRGEGFWEHKHLFFQRWIKFDSQLGRKIFIVFFKRNDLCKMVIVCKCKTSVKVCLYECLHKYLSLCRSGGEGL